MRGADDGGHIRGRLHHLFCFVTDVRQLVEVQIHAEGSSDDPGFAGQVITAMKEACRQVGCVE